MKWINEIYKKNRYTLNCIKRNRLFALITSHIITTLQTQHQAAPPTALNIHTHLCCFSMGYESKQFHPLTMSSIEQKTKLQRVDFFDSFCYKQSKPTKQIKCFLDHRRILAGYKILNLISVSNDLLCFFKLVKNHLSCN